MDPKSPNVLSLTWKERRLLKEVDPEYHRSKCQGSPGFVAFGVSTALPFCVLFGSIWPIVAAGAIGSVAQYAGYRKCIYDIDKAQGLVPGYGFVQPEVNKPETNE